MNAAWMLPIRNPNSSLPIAWNVEERFFDTEFSVKKFLSMVAYALDINGQNIDSVLSMLGGSARSLVTLIKESFDPSFRFHNNKFEMRSLLSVEKPLAIRAIIESVQQIKRVTECIDAIRQMGITQNNVDAIFDLMKAKPNNGSALALIAAYRTYLETGKLPLNIPKFFDAYHKNKSKDTDIASLVNQLTANPILQTIEDLIAKCGFTKKNIKFYLKNATNSTAIAFLKAMTEYFDKGLTKEVISAGSLYIKQKSVQLEKIAEQRERQAETLLKQIGASPDELKWLLELFPSLKEHEADFNEWVTARKSNRATEADLHAKLKELVLGNVNNIGHWCEYMRNANELVGGSDDDRRLLIEYMRSISIDKGLDMVLLNMSPASTNALQFYKIIREFAGVTEKQSLSGIVRGYSKQLGLLEELTKIPSSFPGFPEQLKNAKTELKSGNLATGFRYMLSALKQNSHLETWIHNVSQQIKLSDSFYDVKNIWGLSPEQTAQIDSQIDLLKHSGRDQIQIGDVIYTIDDIKRTLMSIRELQNKGVTDFSRTNLLELSKTSDAAGTAAAYLVTLTDPIYYNAFDVSAFEAGLSTVVNEASRIWSTMTLEEQQLVTTWVQMFGDTSGLSLFLALIDLRATTAESSVLWAGSNPGTWSGSIVLRNAAVFDFVETAYGNLKDGLLGLGDIQNAISTMKGRISVTLNTMQGYSDERFDIYKSTMADLQGEERNRLTNFIAANILQLIAVDNDIPVSKLLEESGLSESVQDAVRFFYDNGLISNGSWAFTLGDGTLNPNYGEIWNQDCPKLMGDIPAAAEPFATLAIYFDLLSNRGSVFSIDKAALSPFMGWNSSLDSAINLYTSGDYLKGLLDEAGWSNMNANHDGLVSWDDLVRLMNHDQAAKYGTIEQLTDHLYNQVLQQMAAGGPSSDVARQILELKKLYKQTLGGFESGAIRNKEAGEKLLKEIQAKIDAFGNDVAFQTDRNNALQLHLPQLTATMPKLQEQLVTRLRTIVSEEHIKKVYELSGNDSDATLKQLQKEFQKYAIFLDRSTSKRLADLLMANYGEVLIKQSFDETLLYTDFFDKVFNPDDPNYGKMTAEIEAAAKRIFGLTVATDVAIIIQRAMRIVALGMRNINNSNNIKMKDIMARYEADVLVEIEKQLASEMDTKNVRINALGLKMSNGTITDTEKTELTKLKNTYDALEKRVSGSSGIYKKGIIHGLSAGIGLVSVTLASADGKWDASRILGVLGNSMLTAGNAVLGGVKSSTELKLIDYCNLDFSDADETWSNYSEDYKKAKLAATPIEGGVRIATGLGYGLIAAASFLNAKNESGARQILDYLNGAVNAASALPPILEGFGQIAGMFKAGEMFKSLSSELAKAWYIRVNIGFTVAQIALILAITAIDVIEDTKWRSAMAAFREKAGAKLTEYFGSDYDIDGLLDPKMVASPPGTPPSDSEPTTS